MIKTILTLLRGTVAAASRELADGNALLLLDGQMRDAGSSLARTQRALAVALAENLREERSRAAIGQRIAGLEVRARAALSGAREDLAADAAETIAVLEGEQIAGRLACTRLATEIADLRRSVFDAERCLVELQWGRRLARVADAVRVSRLGRIEPAELAQCTLADAEATLARL
jgi:phage shock protein A